MIHLFYIGPNVEHLYDTLDQSKTHLCRATGSRSQSVGNASLRDNWNMFLCYKDVDTRGACGINNSILRVI